MWVGPGWRRDGKFLESGCDGTLDLHRVKSYWITHRHYLRHGVRGVFTWGSQRMLALYSAVRSSYPQFIANWQPAERDVIISRRPFGSLVHGVVLADDGAPLFDLPIWSEPAGVICVTTDVEGSLIILEHVRPVMGLHQLGLSDSFTDAEHLGELSLEMPRGFLEPNENAEEAGRREVEEETGLRVTDVRRIGAYNANTSFCTTCHVIVHVTVSDQPVSRPPDAAEGIASMGRYRTDELLGLVRDGKIVCGMTKAALMHFLALNPRGGLA